MSSASSHALSSLLQRQQMRAYLTWERMPWFQYECAFPKPKLFFSWSCWQNGEKLKALLKWILEMLKFEGEVWSADRWAFSGLVCLFPALLSWSLDCLNWKTSVLCDLFLWSCRNFLFSVPSVPYLSHYVMFLGAFLRGVSVVAPRTGVVTPAQCCSTSCTGSAWLGHWCLLVQQMGGIPSSAACDWWQMAQEWLMRPEKYCVLVSWYWNVSVLIRYEAALWAEGGTDPGSLPFLCASGDWWCLRL